MLRSALFNLLFYLVTISILIIGLPFLLLPQKWTMTFVYKAQALSCLWLLKHVANIDSEIRGLENLRPGPVIIAAKHQSVWETFALAPYLNYPIVILKHELMWIPLLGWYALKFGHIPVKRGKGRETMKRLAISARKQLKGRKELLIFPEGTRKTPGAPPAYKTGIYRLYHELNVPVIPVALNSGLYWPRRSFRRYPGTVIAHFLPAIEPGLSREEFMTKLEAQIETASEQLMQEALKSDNPPPKPK